MLVRPKVQMTVAYQDNFKQLFVYSDTFNHRWPGTVTQIPHLNFSKHHMAQSHQPLLLLSDQLPCLQLEQSTLEKEAFATLAISDRMY